MVFNGKNYIEVNKKIISLWKLRKKDLIYLELFF